MMKMNNSFSLGVVVILSLVNRPVVIRGEVGRFASGSQGAVAAGGAEAVETGLEILRKGGNAVDAAASTILALSITDSGSFCFGGEVPIIVYDAKRKVVEVLSGQGAAPRLATLEYFVQKGNQAIPGKGLQPAPVPAVLDVIITALDRYGTLTFAEIAEPSLSILSQRKEEWHKNLAVTLQRLMQAEKKAGADRKRGLRMVADYFYRGPIAWELDRWSRENGGLLRYTDLATHVTRIEEPVQISYRGYTVYKCNTWTQGPHLLQTLGLLEPFDLKAMGQNSPNYIHVVVEAMKLTLADRDEFYGDPLFVNVPLDALLSRRYADLRRPLLDMKKASHEFQPGDPWNMKALLDRSRMKTTGTQSRPSDTTTCLVADRWGNVAAATPSGWAGVVAGQTGVKLGSRLISLNLWPGHPNCIEPGKRPRITLTPTIVLKEGKPEIAVSVIGGDYQDQCTLQLLLNYIEFDLESVKAVSSPRFGTGHMFGSFRQPPPQLGGLALPKNTARETVDELKKRGHRVGIGGGCGAPSMMTFDPQTGLIKATGAPHAAAF